MLKKTFIKTMPYRESTILFIIITFFVKIRADLQDLDSQYEETDEHFMVTERNVFPYMAAVLKGTQYISSGALIDRSWVLTSAGGVESLQESIRLLRIRLGSINYKKGGVLVPVKMLEIHPYYDGKKLGYDLALINLAHPVRFTPSLRPIRLQTIAAEVTSTHFVVASWLGPLELRSKNISHVVQSIDMIKRHRMLTVTHFHPVDPEECDEELLEIGVENAIAICLEPTARDPCLRDVGAPVMLNNILWAVISPWKPEGCTENYYRSIYATLVSEKNVSTWIHANIQGHPWDPKETNSLKLIS